MLRDLLELATVRLANGKTRRHVVQLGRSVRQHAFDARDTLPVIDHPALAAFLGCNEPREIVLPPIDTISLSGLGFVVPYTILATIVSALRPKKIFETGTFRGVGTLTMALNAPEAEIYTLDLPEQYTDAEVETLSKGDKEWVRLSRTSTGFAFLDHPAAARIHSCAATPSPSPRPPSSPTPTSASSTAATPTSASKPTPKPHSKFSLPAASSSGTTMPGSSTASAST
jgi:hypothetical protein